MCSVFTDKYLSVWMLISIEYVFVKYSYITVTILLNLFSMMLNMFNAIYVRWNVTESIRCCSKSLDNDDYYIHHLYCVTIDSPERVQSLHYTYGIWWSLLCLIII